MAEEAYHDAHRSRMSFEDLSDAMDDVNLSVSTETFHTNPTLAPLPRRTNARSTRNKNRDESHSSLSNYLSLTNTSRQTSKLHRNSNDTECNATVSEPGCSTPQAKRKRQSCSSHSSTDIIAKPNTKKSCISNPNLRVSFVLQNNHYNEATVTTADSSRSSSLSMQHMQSDAVTSAHILVQAAGQDATTDTGEKGPRANINPLAEPMWLAARKHFIAAQKATLRLDHLQVLLAEDIMPVEFLGAEKMHGYYASNEGVISDKLMKLMTRQAREKADLVVLELKATAEREQKRAEYYTDVTKQIYTHEEDNTFAESQAGITRVLTFFKKSEQSRLDTLATKERARQPDTEAELTELIFMPIQRPSRDSSNQRGRKRARNSKNNSRNNTPNPSSRTETPSTSTNPAPVREDRAPAPQGRNNQQPPRYNGPTNNPYPRYGGYQQQQRPRAQAPGRRSEPNNTNNRRPQQHAQRQQAPRPAQTAQSHRQQPQATSRNQQRQQNGNQAPEFSDSTHKLLSALSVIKDYMG